MIINREYEKNIKLEQKFITQIKCILGCQFIGQDPIMDEEQATDLLTFTIKPFKVGVRLRRYNIYCNPEWRKQFTIRYKLNSGNETEYDKIKKGFCDYILYGFLNNTGEKIIQYFIGDLNVFRKYEEKIQAEIKQNKDENPSKFKAYYINDFPEDFVIKDYNLPKEDLSEKFSKKLEDSIYN